MNIRIIGNMGQANTFRKQSNPANNRQELWLLLQDDRLDAGNNTPTYNLEITSTKYDWVKQEDHPRLHSVQGTPKYRLIKHRVFPRPKMHDAPHDLDSDSMSVTITNAADTTLKASDDSTVQVVDERYLRFLYETLTDSCDEAAEAEDE